MLQMKLNRMVASVRNGLCLGLLTLGVVGCSSHTDIESNLGLNDAPDWVNEGTNVVNDDDGRLLQGIGMAVPLNDVSLQKSTADNRARAELARILSTIIDNSMQDYAAAVGDVSTSSIEREINSISQASLSGSKIMARWKNPETGNIYSFAELDLDQVEALIEKSGLMNQDLKGFFNKHVETNFDRFLKDQNKSN